MTYARQMFFMTLLYDTDLEVPADKAQMYLEIFGNTQLSAKAFQVYIAYQLPSRRSLPQRAIKLKKSRQKNS